MNVVNFHWTTLIGKTALFVISVVIGTPGVWADQLVFSPSKDNTLYEHPTANLSNGGGSALFLGAVGDDQSNRLRRALIAFDLTSIPAGATIQTVQLALYNNRVAANDTPAGGTAILHRMTVDWGEGSSIAPGGQGGGGAAGAGDATWFFRFFNTDAWASNGGDFDAATSGSTSYSASAPETITFSSTPGMVNDVQLWVNNPAQNFGWIVLGNEVVDASAQRIASREDLFDPVPTLTIDFTLPSP